MLTVAAGRTVLFFLSFSSNFLLFLPPSHSWVLRQSQPQEKAASSKKSVRVTLLTLGGGHQTVPKPTGKAKIRGAVRGEHRSTPRSCRTSHCEAFLKACVGWVRLVQYRHTHTGTHTVSQAHYILPYANWAVADVGTCSFLATSSAVIGACTISIRKCVPKTQHAHEPLMAHSRPLVHRCSCVVCGAQGWR